MVYTCAGGGHCFTDGNKRTALQVLDFVLIGHDIEIDLPQVYIAEVIEWIADKTFPRDDLVEYVAAVVKEQQEIPISEGSDSFNS